MAAGDSESVCPVCIVCWVFAVFVVVVLAAAFIGWIQPVKADHDTATRYSRYVS